MWSMILTGMALAAVFVFALRSQINAYKIAQAEERLKMKLDEYASQQRFLTLDQQRALSAGESERAGRRNGLVHLKLDRAPQRESKDSVKPVSETKVVKVVKTGKAVKVVNVVKLNVTKRESAANKARTNVVKTRKKDQRQMSSARRY